MFLIRVLLVILALVFLRRALSWVFDRWGSLGSGNSPRSRTRSGPRHASTTQETLSDQSIDEADYEELH
jgi:hypothetical protein